MTVNSTTAHVSASIGAVITKPLPNKTEITKADFKNAVPADLDKLNFRKATWEDLWGVETTESAGEDGMVTRTMSGSVNIIGKDIRGKAAFSIKTTFNASSYQVGDLSEAADALSAIHAAQKSVWESDPAQVDVRLPQQLEVVYGKQKEEAAGSFADMVSGGQTEERDKVCRSIQAVFASLDAKYQSITARMGPETWMKDSWFDSVLSLRRLGAAVRPETGGASGLYSLQELEMSARRLCGGFDHVV